MSFLYRGVHAKHPMNAAARLGIVAPGDPQGTVTPKQHSVEDVSADSPYTSWTSNEQVARGFANSRGPGGILLRVRRGVPSASEQWRWEYSDDPWGEDEILLFGVRMGVEVLES